jgi:hypothetical protein
MGLDQWYYRALASWKKLLDRLGRAIIDRDSANCDIGS